MGLLYKKIGDFINKKCIYGQENKLLFLQFNQGIIKLRTYLGK